jgi:hypothetical protein
MPGTNGRPRCSMSTTVVCRTLVPMFWTHCVERRTGACACTVRFGGDVTEISRVVFLVAPHNGGTFLH